MVNFTKEADEIWRDYATDGVPASGARQPVKADIRTWGGKIENVMSAMSDPLYPRGVRVVGILVSQSNGYSNEDATGGGSTATNARVYAWANSSSGWVTAALGSDPFRPDEGSGIPNNLLFQFGKWLEETTGDEIRLFLHAIPDTNIDKWLTVANGGVNSSANRYDSTTSTSGGTVLKTQTLAAAMFASSALTSIGKTKFDHIIIVKGENEEGFGTTFAEAQFLKVVDQLRAESWADDDTHILVVEMCREENKYPTPIDAWGNIVRGRQRPNMAIVPSHGLASVGDGTHFNGAAHVTLGTERLPAALKSLTAPHQYPAGYDGRPNLINVDEATTALAPKVIDISAPFTIVNVLYSSGDTFLEIGPSTVGQGGVFWVRHWASNYVTHVDCGAGSTFDPDIWETSQASADIGANESMAFFKGGASETGPYQILADFRRDLRDRDPRNAVLNGDFEIGSRNWTMGAGWTVNFDNANSHTGKWVAVNTDTAGPQTDLTAKNYVRANVGDYVVAEIMTKRGASLTATNVRVQIAYYDKALTEISTENSSNFNASLTTNFQKIMVGGAAPLVGSDKTMFVRPRFRVAKTLGDIYGDDMRMTVIGKDQVFAWQYVMQKTDRAALASNTSLQAIFDEVTDGDATLEVGLYEVDMAFSMTGLSGSSGDIKSGFGGLASVTYGLRALASKGSSTEFSKITAATATSLIAANTSTIAEVHITGLMNVTTAGTWIPQVAQGVAATAVVKALAYCKLKRLPTDGTGKLAMGLWG